MRFTFLAVSPLVLLTAACNFSVDPTLVRNDRMDGGTDSGGHSGGPSNNSGDSSNSGSGGGSSGSGQQWLVDGGDSGGPNGLDDGGSHGVFCNQQSDCGADQVCASFEASGAKSCTSRCGTDGTCWATQADRRDVTFASDGARVCYALGATPDPDGLDILQNASVFGWDVTGAPKQLATGYAQAEAKLVADGTCYFGTELGLVRVGIDARTLPQRLNRGAGRVVYAWKTDTHVWWSTEVSYGSYDLFRVARSENAAVEQMQSNARFAWTTGDSARLFRLTYADGHAAIETAQVEDLNKTSTLVGSQKPIYVHGNDLYLCEDANSSRVDHVDIDANTTTTVVDPMTWSFRNSVVIDGDWLLWAQNQEGSSSRFNRFFRIPTKQDLPQVEVLRVPLEKDALSATFAVVKNYLIHVRQGLVAASPIAPPPCGPQLKCSFATACTADLACK